MLLTSSSLLQLPPLKPSKSSPFLSGSTVFPDISKPFSSLSLNPCPPRSLPVIKAMKNMQGRVVCATNDKTVAVEVTRLAPHPKYKRRVRKKKKYQAHDPENQFKVGDFVQLEKSRPISKTKAFLALPIISKHKQKEVDSEIQELGLPLQTQQA